jgi:hypothetical protein
MAGKQKLIEEKMTSISEQRRAIDQCRVDLERLRRENARLCELNVGLRHEHGVVALDSLPSASLAELTALPRDDLVELFGRVFGRLQVEIRRIAGLKVDLVEVQNEVIRVRAESASLLRLRNEHARGSKELLDLQERVARLRKMQATCRAQGKIKEKLEALLAERRGRAQPVQAWVDPLSRSTTTPARALAFTQDPMTPELQALKATNERLRRELDQPVPAPSLPWAAAGGGAGSARARLSDDLAVRSEASVLGDLARQVSALQERNARLEEALRSGRSSRGARVGLVEETDGLADADVYARTKELEVRAAQAELDEIVAAGAKRLAALKIRLAGGDPLSGPAPLTPSRKQPQLDLASGARRRKEADNFFLEPLTSPQASRSYF